MRAARAYADPAQVAAFSRQLVANGETVLQIHRLAGSQADHVHKLLRFFNPPIGAHVLDVGCGVGGVADLMSKERPDLRFTLLNNSAEQLELCPSRFETICADAHAIPLPDASIDATMICYALGHMDPVAALKECGRVTRQAGHLFIYDLTGGDSHRLIDALDFQAFSIEQITAAAEHAGFVREKLHVPRETHVEHFYDKVPAPRFAEIFEGIRPTLFRFSKQRPSASAEVSKDPKHEGGSAAARELVFDE